MRYYDLRFPKKDLRGELRWAADAAAVVAVLGLVRRLEAVELLGAFRHCPAGRRPPFFGGQAPRAPTQKPHTKPAHMGKREGGALERSGGPGRSWWQKDRGGFGGGPVGLRALRFAGFRLRHFIACSIAFVRKYLIICALSYNPPYKPPYK